MKSLQFLSFCALSTKDLDKAKKEHPYILYDVLYASNPVQSRIEDSDIFPNHILVCDTIDTDSDGNLNPKKIHKHCVFTYLPTTISVRFFSHKDRVSRPYRTKVFPLTEKGIDQYIYFRYDYMHFLPGEFEGLDSICYGGNVHIVLDI